MSGLNSPCPDRTWRPSEYLRTTESEVISLRKQLCHANSNGHADSGKMDDAIDIALLVEDMCRYGKDVDAAEAIEVVADVEVLIDMLIREIDALLAS